MTALDRQADVLRELADAIKNDSNARCSDELLAWSPEVRSKCIFIGMQRRDDHMSVPIARAILRDSAEGIGLVTEYLHATIVPTIYGYLKLWRLSSFNLACLRRENLDFVRLFLEFGLDPSKVVIDNKGQQSTLLEDAVWYSSRTNANGLEAFGAAGPLIEMLVAAGGAQAVKLENPLFKSAGDPFAAARLSNNDEALAALTDGYVALEAKDINSSAGPGKRQAKAKIF